MVVTRFSPEVLRAAMRRDGVWCMDQYGLTNHFFHRCCFTRAIWLRAIARGF